MGCCLLTSDSNSAIIKILPHLSISFSLWGVRNKVIHPPYFSVRFLKNETFSSITTMWLWYLTKWIILWYYLILWGFPGGSDGKESACNVGDLGLIPVSGRFPGKGNVCWLQYSYLENSMGRGAWLATKSRTWLRDYHFYLHFFNT